MTAYGHVDLAAETALNRICPYFTMFPLRFPYRLLRRHAQPGERVLDPFCGRGTTNYAARLVGLDNVGVDSSPIATAISAAKVVNVRPANVAAAYADALSEVRKPAACPEGEFWRLAYAPDVLVTLCRLREALRADCQAPARKALRAILLGALHGPRAKYEQTYLSNQSPRTYAPKPGYATRFWRQRRLAPPHVDIVGIIAARARRFYGHERSPARGRIVCGDSRSIDRRRLGHPFDWVITSPPYYGMRTYIPDQWLRNWFLGGPATTDYSCDSQLGHGSPGHFASDLRRVWQLAAAHATDTARLVVRFGGINDRHVDPLATLKESLQDSGWRVVTTHDAGSAAAGRRQAAHFGAARVGARQEFDLWAVRAG